MSNVREGKKKYKLERGKWWFGVPLYERVGTKPDIGLKNKLGTYKSGKKGRGRVWMMSIMKGTFFS